MKMTSILRARVAATAVLGLLSFGWAHAELIATPLSGDARLVKFNYDKDNTFLVLTRPLAATHIQFRDDERVLSIVAGDTHQWEISPIKTGKSIFIKPVYEDLETSMTVITDKRTYEFVLKSTGPGRKWYQRVSWVYSSEMVVEFDAQINESELEEPGQVVASRPPGSLPSQRAPADLIPFPDSTSGVGGPSAALPWLTSPASIAGGQSQCGGAFDPSTMDLNYRIKGDAEFKPTQVFDNGRFTYFRLPKGIQELPALFSIASSGEYGIVNYTVCNEMIVAQRLLDEAVLKLGKSEVFITRRAENSKARSSW